MGFRKGSYATVWEVRTLTPTLTKARISIDRKNRETGEYVQDFSGFVVFIGTANASKAARLKEKDRIRLGDVDVTNRYDKEKKVEYTDYKIFDFEDANKNDGGGTAPAQQSAPAANTMYEGNTGEEDDDLPF